MQTRPSTSYLTCETQDTMGLLCETLVESKMRTSEEGELDVEQGLIEWLQNGDPRIYVAPQATQKKKKILVINDWSLILDHNDNMRRNIFWRIHANLLCEGYRIFIIKNSPDSKKLEPVELKTLSEAEFESALLDQEVLPSEELKGIVSQYLKRTENLDCTGDEIQDEDYFFFSDSLFTLMKPSQDLKKIPYNVKSIFPRQGRNIFLKDFSGITRERFFKILRSLRGKKILGYVPEPNLDFPFREEFLEYLQNEHPEMVKQSPVAPDDSKLSLGDPPGDELTLPGVYPVEYKMKLQDSLRPRAVKIVRELRIDQQMSSKLSLDEVLKTYPEVKHVRLDSDDKAIQNLSEHSLDSFIWNLDKQSRVTFTDLGAVLCKCNANEFRFTGNLLFENNNILALQHFGRDGLRLKNLYLDVDLVDEKMGPLCDQDEDAIYLCVVKLADFITLLNNTGLRKLHLRIRSGWNQQAISLFDETLVRYIGPISKMEFIYLNIQHTPLPGIEKKFPNAVIDTHAPLAKNISKMEAQALIRVLSPALASSLTNTDLHDSAKAIKENPKQELPSVRYFTSASKWNFPTSKTRLRVCHKTHITHSKLGFDYETPEDIKQLSKEIKYVSADKFVADKKRVEKMSEKHFGEFPVTLAHEWTPLPSLFRNDNLKEIVDEKEEFDIGYSPSHAMYFARLKGRGEKNVNLRYVITTTEDEQLRNIISDRSADNLFKSLKLDTNAALVIPDDRMDEWQALYDSPIEEQIGKLIGFCEHFGSGEEGPVGIALFNYAIKNQCGACACRSLIFQKLAQALNLPCRVVANLEHAWVEIEYNHKIYAKDLGGFAATSVPVAASCQPVEAQKKEIKLELKTPTEKIINILPSLHQPQWF